MEPDPKNDKSMHEHNTSGSPPILREALEELYNWYNKREWVHPDPLEFLYDYDDLHDREVVGLIASSLAYGRVVQILKSVFRVLDRMPSPSAFLMRATPDSLRSAFSGFRHRFATGEELSALLFGAKRVIGRYGSLHACFTSSLRDDHPTILPAVSAFTSELISAGGGCVGHLLPRPERGSACKRINLFLRWMVRRDEVDPGGWSVVPASKLIVPLDTHMHRICRALGLTDRKQADMRTAIQITEAFREIAPDDPVRYDFAITRLGIRSDTDLDEFLSRCGLGATGGCPCHNGDQNA